MGEHKRKLQILEAAVDRLVHETSDSQNGEVLMYKGDILMFVRMITSQISSCPLNSVERVWLLEGTILRLTGSLKQGGDAVDEARIRLEDAAALIWCIFTRLGRDAMPFGISPEFGKPRPRVKMGENGEPELDHDFSTMDEEQEALIISAAAEARRRRGG